MKASVLGTETKILRLENILQLCCEKFSLCYLDNVDKLSRLTRIVRVVVVVFLFVFPCFLCLFRGFFAGFVLFLFRSSNLCHQLLSLGGRGGLVWVCLAGIS